MTKPACSACQAPLPAVGREKAAQALADEVARRLLASVPVREAGAMVEIGWCQECRERRKMLNRDTGEWVCGACDSSGVDSI